MTAEWLGEGDVELLDVVVASGAALTWTDGRAVTIELLDVVLVTMVGTATLADVDVATTDSDVETDVSSRLVVVVVGSIGVAVVGEAGSLNAVAEYCAACEDRSCSSAPSLDEPSVPSSVPESSDGSPAKAPSSTRRR